MSKQIFASFAAFTYSKRITPKVYLATSLASWKLDDKQLLRAHTHAQSEVMLWGKPVKKTKKNADALNFQICIGRGHGRAKSHSFCLHSERFTDPPSYTNHQSLMPVTLRTCCEFLKKAHKRPLPCFKSNVCLLSEWVCETRKSSFPSIMNPSLFLTQTSIHCKKKKKKRKEEEKKEKGDWMASLTGRHMSGVRACACSRACAGYVIVLFVLEVLSLTSDFSVVHSSGDRLIIAHILAPGWETKQGAAQSFSSFCVELSEKCCSPSLSHPL